eukprot:TRINITY_DN4732_c0_g1_i1.p1 TRINITY_DN4732_c0_g1~~TRINITY_DN4732_c0_g1_i1.p1  ORF type:complete len:687 (-),score=98.79 TRINITY_DN4732_c0_g1_i1:303-2363(-)
MASPRVPTTPRTVWGKLVSINQDSFPDVILLEPEVWLGRDPSCHPDARFSEVVISKKHCRIYNQNGQAMLLDNSSNGTFVDGKLVGRANLHALVDGSIITLIVPSLDSKNFTKTTPAYKFVAGEQISNGVSDTNLEELVKSTTHLTNKMEKCLKGIDEYKESGNSLFARGSNLFDLFQDDTYCDDTTRRLISTLKRIEEMKQDLHKKTSLVLTFPINQFKENELNNVIEMDKTTKAVKKKYDEIKSKLKKESDPFKEKQLEQKFVEVKNSYELQSAVEMSKLKEVQAKAVSNINNWLIHYTLTNLEFFRSGCQLLEAMEHEMQQKTHDLSIEAKVQEEKSLKTIHRLKELQITSKNPKLRREKQGYLMKKGKPLWWVIMEGTVSYYKSWKESTPLGSIDLVLCSVKLNAESKKRLCFELTSPGESHILQALSSEDLEDWINVFKNSVSHQLEIHKKMGSDSAMTLAMGSQTLAVPKITPLSQVQGQTSENLYCVDCNASNPDWASINLGCLMCYECSGVHRALGTHISKVRSLTLDKWEPQLLQIMKYLGNSIVNSIFEANIPPKYTKPVLNSERTLRERFIKAKYCRKKFVENRGIQDVVELSKLLYTAVSEDEKSSLELILRLLAFGANISLPNADEGGTTALHYAAAAGNVVLVEFLLQNGANANAVDNKVQPTPSVSVAVCL